MFFSKDSSQEYVLINGKWEKREYSPRRLSFDKKKKPVSKQRKRYANDKPLHKAIKRERVQSSAGTTKGRKGSQLTPGEKRIADFLIANNIFFHREKYFPNLYNKITNRLLYFDFYIPRYNLVIEYDGIQHFKNVYGDKQLANQKERDKAKWVYCKKHKIHLLRIKCFDDKELETIICKKFDEIAPIA